MSSDSKVDLPENIDAAVLKIAGVVVLGAIMSILDITVVNVALPTFQTRVRDRRATRSPTRTWRGRSPPTRSPSRRSSR